MNGSWAKQFWTPALGMTNHLAWKTGSPNHLLWVTGSPNHLSWGCPNTTTCAGYSVILPSSVSFSLSWSAPPNLPHACCTAGNGIYTISPSGSCVFFGSFTPAHDVCGIRTMDITASVVAGTSAPRWHLNVRDRFSGTCEADYTWIYESADLSLTGGSYDCTGSFSLNFVSSAVSCPSLPGRYYCDWPTTTLTLTGNP